MSMSSSDPLFSLAPAEEPLPTPGSSLPDPTPSDNDFGEYTVRRHRRAVLAILKVSLLLAAMVVASALWRPVVRGTRVFIHHRIEGEITDFSSKHGRAGGSAGVVDAAGAGVEVLRTSNESSSLHRSVPNSALRSLEDGWIHDGSEGSKGTGRKGSFLVLGDWGFDDENHGNIWNSNCQKAVGQRMLEKMQELGDVKFIVNLGDAFYPQGVRGKDDPKWDNVWRGRYAEELRSVPWYSTYGNHDYEIDPCLCSDSPQECALYNADISDTNFFYMPDFNWFKEHPELELEVVSLDMNQFAETDHCQSSPCPEKCYQNLGQRARDGTGLLNWRVGESQAKNLVVFSHYPTDYLIYNQDLLNGLRRGTNNNGGYHHVEYFGGHRHSVDQHSTESIHPNSNWLVGGGGGYSNDGGSQGFVVGEIMDNGDLQTYSVLVDDGACFGW